MIIYRLEEAFFVITISYLGIWILLSEIYEIFNLDDSWFFEDQYPNITKLFYESSNDKSLDILFNLIGIIIILPISIIFVAIRRNSLFLYLVFYFASIIEMGIIIT